MRRLSQTAVLLALTSCMSPAGKTKRAAEVSAAKSESSRPSSPGLPEVIESQAETLAAKEMEVAPEAPTPIAEETHAAPTQGLPVDPNCQIVKTKETFPLFLAPAQIFVRQAAERCQTPSGEEGVVGRSKIIAAGLPCTQSYGRMTRLYESSISRPDAVKFHMPLNCLAIPDQDHPAKFLSTHLSAEAAQKLVAFYPIQVTYWEFKETPDSGFEDALLLKSEKGRARFVKWWAADADTIPVRVYGRESAMIPSGEVYEAQIKIAKRRGSQFQVQVENIRVLEGPEVEQVLTRCKENNNANACAAAFR